MLRLNDALVHVLERSPALQFGLAERLFNLTQLARFVRPLVEARTKKEISTSALVMALSRLNRSPVKTRHAPGRMRIENLAVSSGLTVVTLFRTPDTHRAVNTFYTRLKKVDAYLTITEGSNEITVIFPSEHRTLLKELVPLPWRHVREDIASLGVRFHHRYLEVPGFLYQIMQQLALQSINIVELASTATEIIVYLDDRDVRLAFDTLMRAFVERGD